MVIGKNIVPFITEFIDALDDALSQHKSPKRLSTTQKYWLAFCLMGILATKSVCWAKFERVSFGQYGAAALSWVFHHASIPWKLLLRCSVGLILNHYGITQGTLVIDDSDNKRSKNTTKIWHVHKLKDKASGGYVMGQGLVFMVLVTPTITLPVGIEFYMPDPDYTVWKKVHDKLKKNGIPAKQRPPKPAKKDEFPTKIEIAISLVEQFHACFSDIKINCIAADALYGTKIFFSGVSKFYPKAQFISQIKKTQNVLFRNRKMSVKNYFLKRQGGLQAIRIRGGKEIMATVGSARLHVCSHGKKIFVIALKYEGEEEYRFIIASDLTWRTIDIVEAYSQRWLVEVFIQDWKANEGWATLTKLQGEKGSRRGMILSLLVDHCLFFHPDQIARFENKLPALTVGCLRRKTNLESLFLFITEIIDSEDPREELDRKFSIMKENFLNFENSKKHMVARVIGNMGPTESLKYKEAAA
ncbi:MAG: transposase [Deltaproteobacteria bacterium]|nr:transposase [Deltaproteobacteria bacterium]